MKETRYCTCKHTYVSYMYVYKEILIEIHKLLQIKEHNIKILYTGIMGLQSDHFQTT